MLNKETKKKISGIILNSIIILCFTVLAGFLILFIEQIEHIVVIIWSITGTPFQDFIAQRIIETSNFWFSIYGFLLTISIIVGISILLCKWNKVNDFMDKTIKL